MNWISVKDNHLVDTNKMVDVNKRSSNNFVNQNWLNMSDKVKVRVDRTE